MVIVGFRSSTQPTSFRIFELNRAVLGSDSVISQQTKKGIAMKNFNQRYMSRYVYLITCMVSILSIDHESNDWSIVVSDLGRHILTAACLAGCIPPQRKAYKDWISKRLASLFLAVLDIFDFLPEHSESYQQQKVMVFPEFLSIFYKVAQA